jgi:sec1 family domain-containing protein 1
VTYELDFPTDDILKENAFLGFHEAAENVDKSMTKFKSEYDKLSAQKPDGSTDISSSLTSAIDQLP